MPMTRSERREMESQSFFAYSTTRKRTEGHEEHEDESKK
jgi:hypothetical protein